MSKTIEIAAYRENFITHILPILIYISMLIFCLFLIIVLFPDIIFPLVVAIAMIILIIGSFRSSFHNRLFQWITISKSNVVLRNSFKTIILQKDEIKSFDGGEDLLYLNRKNGKPILIIVKKVKKMDILIHELERVGIKSEYPFDLRSSKEEKWENRKIGIFGVVHFIISGIIFILLIALLSIFIPWVRSGFIVLPGMVIWTILTLITMIYVGKFLRKMEMLKF